MLCAISGEAPQHPVASRKSGTVFERRLIEAYIAENGSDPVTGEALSVDDLLDLQQSRVVKPRPPQLTSIPALLATFQNEWDALVLESFQLKQQLAETRQELSAALYYNDAAQSVIARLQRERDAARDALARVTVTGGAGTNGTAAAAVTANGSGGDAMQVDGQALPDAIVAKIEQTQTQLQGTRRRRPVPDDWTTAEAIERFEVKSTADTQFTGAKALAGDESGDFFLCGDSDGDIGVYDVKQSAFTTRSNVGAGAVTSGAWADGDKAVVATASGAVVVTRGGSVEAKFQQHAGAATAVATHPSGELIASVGVDKSYVLYDLQGAIVLTQIYTDAELTTVAFHPDGHLLAAGTAAGTIKLFDVKSSSLLHTFSPPDASTASPSQALSFSENGTWLAAAYAGSPTVTVWDLRKMNVVKALDAGAAVAGLAWDYTGQFLAAVGPAGVVVSQYSKAGKAWSEPLRKAVGAVDVKWAASARSLVDLTGDGAVAVLTS